MSILMVRLAIWQFDRLDERKVEVAALRAELAGPPAVVDEAVDLGAIDANRKVEVRGTVDRSKWVFVRNVLQEGVRGYHELVPVTLADGSVVVVKAGFIEEEAGQDDIAARYGFPQPVAVIGLTRHGQSSIIQPTERQFGGDGNVATVGAVDFGQLSALAPGPLAPVWVQQLEPGLTDATVLPSPDLTEGPHLGYGLQWVSFTLIITVGYGFLLYRVATDQRAGGT